MSRYDNLNTKETATYLKVHVGTIRRLVRGGIPVFKIYKEWRFGNGLILFIDDEDILAAMGQAMLERLGYRVTVRRSSIDALNTFQNHPDQFDLVILTKQCLV